MRWILSWMLGVAMALGLCSVGAGQDRGHIENLLAKLDDSATARGASEELKTLAKQDQDSRQYLANRLPSLITTGSRGDLQLWYSSLELVAELKIIETVPVLTELLRKENRGPVTDFIAAARLYDDPVAYALSQIGEPATQSVAKLFEDGDAATRRRAAIVLGNIATPHARQALLSQIQNEQADDLRAVMQDEVTYIDKKVRLGIAR
jgi:HEAT repeat protein